MDVAESTSEWRGNWTAVLGGFAGISVATVATYTTGVMVGPLEREFGWSRAEILSGPLVPAILAVFCAPLVGLTIDRYGPRRIAIAGVLLICASLAGLGLANSSVWSWRALWVPMGIAMIMVKPAVWTAGVSSLFSRSRGMALAVALSGTAICASVSPPLAAHLVSEFGWRAAYAALGGFWFVVAFPAVFALYTSASDRSRKAGVSGAKNSEEAFLAAAIRSVRVLRSWKYAALLIAAVTMVLTSATLVINLVPVLTSQSFDPVMAATIAGTLGFATIPGRLAGGYLLDRFNGNIVAAGTLVLPMIAAALLLLFPGSYLFAIAAALTLGLAMGSELDAISYLASRHFDFANFGFVYAVIGGFQALAVGVGPLLFNYVFDVTGTYDAALVACFPIAILGAVLLLTLGDYWVDPANPREASN